METYLICLAAALVGGLMLSRLTKLLNLPAVTAYLVAGLLLGPFGIGALGLEGLGFNTMAQMESGLTMQLLNHSRAASGAEHLMAHLVEMHPPRFENAEGIHGECVGVGTFACIREYHKLAGMKPKAKPFQPLTRDWVLEKFGERLADGIMKENENDVLGTFDPQNIVDHWDEIKAILDALPSVEEMEKLYSECGCKYLPEHIGIDPALADEMLDISAAIRNRNTLIRMKRVLDFE